MSATIGREGSPRLEVVKRDAFYGRCDDCGWLTTQRSSIEEAANLVCEHARAVHDAFETEVSRVDWSRGVS